MSKNHTTLIQRYPGQNIPETYLRTMLKARPNAGGYAVQVVEKGQPALVIDHMDVGVELGAVQELFNTPEYKDSHFLFAFHQFEKFAEDDLQPIAFQIDGVDDLAVGIEGDFPTMIEGDLHPETKLFSTVISPNLTKLRKFTSGELDNFMKELSDPTFRDMIMARIASRGYLCFLPPVGEPVWIEKEKFGSSFPWGRVSNTHGYVETPATVAESKATKVGWWTSKAGRSTPVAEDKPVVPAEARPPLGMPDPKPDTKIDPPAATPSAPSPLPTDPPEGEWKRVPPMSKNDRKAFIRRVTGQKDLPENWQDPTFVYWETKYISQARNLPELKEKLEQQQKPVADAGTKLSNAPSRGSEVVHEANTMILTAEEMSSAETSLLKIMDRQGKEITPPLEIQKLETKYPTFTGKFGIKLPAINNSLPADVAEFFKENGKAGFHLYLETRGALREAEAALAAIGDKHTKAVDTHVLAKDELKPEAKTGTGWGNWTKR